MSMSMLVVPIPRCRALVVARCLSLSAKRFSPEPGFKYTEFIHRGNSTPPRIAGRKWLPGSTFVGNKLPEFLAPPRKNLPAVYDAILADKDGPKYIEMWAAKTRAVLDEKLHVFGTILFKGLPLHSVDDFSTFSKCLGYQFGSYKGAGGERHEVAEYVQTATDAEKSIFTLEPHNEMAYTTHYPLKIMFYCDVPPHEEDDGETVICDVRDTLPKLDPKIVEKFERLGIKYSNYISNSSEKQYRCISNVFGTTDKSIIGKFLADHDYEYKWDDDGSLSYWITLPVFTIHPKTGEKIWFNQASSYHASYLRENPVYEGMDYLPDNKLSNTCCYGDGSEIEPEVVQHVRDVIWQSSVGFQMKKGEILVFDNLYSQHGRIGYTGERKLYVNLIAS